MNENLLKRKTKVLLVDPKFSRFPDCPPFSTINISKNYILQLLMWKFGKADTCIIFTVLFHFSSIVFKFWRTSQNKSQNVLGKNGNQKSACLNRLLFSLFLFIEIRGSFVLYFERFFFRLQNGILFRRWKGIAKKKPKFSLTVLL